MTYIKATKTSLYNLVLEKFQGVPWVNIPPKKWTVFHKVYRRHDYFLDWSCGDHRYRVFLAQMCEYPFMSIEQLDWSTGEEQNLMIINLTLDELRAVRMLGERTKKRGVK